MLTAGLLFGMPAAALADEAPQSAADGTDQAVATETDQTQTGEPTDSIDQGGETPDGTDQGGTPDATEQGGQTEEAPAPAPSSNTETYEEAGIYKVTVDYVDQSGKKIAPSYQVALQAGQSWSAASPDPIGYEMLDASQATLSGTVGGDDHNPTYKVVYKVSQVTYTVIHEVQTGDGYTTRDTDILLAEPGSTQSVTTKTYYGYHLAEGNPTTVKVTDDGRATVVVRYNQDIPTHSVFFVTGGSYVPAITGEEGSAVAAPADPTKPGYTFAGWDTDGDGKKDALPDKIGKADVTATAVWEPAQVTYTVAYYVQNGKGDDGSPTFVSKTSGGAAVTQTASALSDHKVTEDEANTFAAYINTTTGNDRIYHYDPTRTELVTVAGDGTTLLKLYYTYRQVLVHITLDTRDGKNVVEPYVITYGDRVVFPKESESLAAAGHAGDSTWHVTGITNDITKLGETGDGVYPGVNDVSAEPNENGQLEAFFTIEVSQRALVHSYLQNFYENNDVSGTPTNEDDFYYYSTSASADRYTGATYWYRDSPTSGWYLHSWRVAHTADDKSGLYRDEWDETVGDLSNHGVNFTDWVLFADTPKNNQGYWVIPSNYLDLLNDGNVWQVRRARRTFYANYYSNGVLVKSTPVKYGWSYKTAEGIDIESMPHEAGMVFDGWYNKNGKLLTKDEYTMNKGANFYARWKRPDVSVTFDSRGGSEVEKQTVAWGKEATEPKAPTREGYAFEGWYYLGGDSQVPARFSFDMPLEADQSLFASWRKLGKTAGYTVIHKASDGTVFKTEEGEAVVGDYLTRLALAANDPARKGYQYVGATGLTTLVSMDAAKNVLTFVYQADPVHVYTVHFVDAATGKPVADDAWYAVPDVVMDVFAKDVAGWRLRGSGDGYVSVDGTEVTFYYEKLPEPAKPETPHKASYQPKHAAVSEQPALPATGDAGTAGAAVAAAGGLAALAAGTLLRRRREDAE